MKVKLPKKNIKKATQGVGVEMDQGDQVMQFIAQALQQGENPLQVLKELVQQGVPQDQAQQMVGQVAQQLQGSQEQQTAKTGLRLKRAFTGFEINNTDGNENLTDEQLQDKWTSEKLAGINSSVGFNSQNNRQGILPGGHPTIQKHNQQSLTQQLGDYSYNPNTYIGPNHQRNSNGFQHDANERNRAELSQFALWQAPYYAGNAILGQVDYNQNKQQKQDLLDQGVSQDDKSIKSLNRQMTGDILQEVGGFAGQTFQDVSNIVGGIGTAMHNSRVRNDESERFMLEKRKQAEMNPTYGDESELGNGTRAAYSKFGTKIQRYKSGGKNIVYASNGMELPENANDLITKNPNVLIEGNGLGKAGVGESVGDTNTGTVTNSKGAGTHEQQDSGKAKEMALSLGKDSTVLPAGLGITLKQANKLFGHIPSITEPLNEKFQDPNKTISWGEIGNTQNTKNQVKEIGLIDKGISKQIKIKKKNEGRADNPNETSISQKTGELNNKFADYEINNLGQAKQEVEEQMALQTAIHNEVIYPTFEHMKKNLKVYGDKVANSDGKAEYGKKIKLPRADEGVKSPRTKDTDPNSVYSSYPNYENAYRSQHEFLGQEPKIIPGMFNTPKGAIEAQGYSALNFPELTGHFYTNNPDVRATNKMWDLGKEHMMKRYPGINPTDEAIGTYLSQNLPLILGGHMDSLGPNAQGYRGFNAEKLELESPEALQEFISKAGTPIKTSRGDFYVDPSDKFTYVNPSLNKNYKAKVEPSTGDNTTTPLNTNTKQINIAKRPYIPEGLHPMQLTGELASLFTGKQAVPYIEDLGAKNALASTTKQRFTDIQPQLNRLRRGTFAQRRFVGTDPVSQAQQAQAYANEYEAANQVYNQKYNADAQIQQNYQQMENALREKAGTNKAKALDTLAQRTAHRDEGYYETRKMDLRDIGKKYMQNRLENRQSALLQDMFPNLVHDRLGYGTNFTPDAFTYEVLKDRNDILSGNKTDYKTRKAKADAEKSELELKKLKTELGESRYGNKIKLPKKAVRKTNKSNFK